MAKFAQTVRALPALARSVWWILVECAAEALHRETGKSSFERLRKVAHARGLQAEADLDRATGVAS